MQLVIRMTFASASVQKRFMASQSVQFSRGQFCPRVGYTISCLVIVSVLKLCDSD